MKMIPESINHVLNSAGEHVAYTVNVHPAVVGRAVYDAASQPGDGVGQQALFFWGLFDQMHRRHPDMARQNVWMSSLAERLDLPARQALITLAGQIKKLEDK